MKFSNIYIKIGHCYNCENMMNIDSKMKQKNRLLTEKRNIADSGRSFYILFKFVNRKKSVNIQRCCVPHENIYILPSV